MPFLKTGDLTTMIYEYNRGDKVVKVDPAIVWRKLNIACRNIGETFDSLMTKWNDSVVKEEDTEEEVTHKLEIFSELEPKIEKITREAFKIPEIDEEGRGGTVALVLMTLNDFLSERKKKARIPRHRHLHRQLWMGSTRIHRGNSRHRALNI